ncbi:MAG TPA: acyl-CoA dehydrogenase family protein [Stellaceae bacterium]|jgi:3-hydroxy-9,10-secoandrosta-1,3,5(10)-triene-9,17-dione monooxygenase|nr:acyl-CoA dehydrogenase family protein [Stellaceae bacterium]
MPTISHAEAIARAKKIGEVAKANAVATEKLRHLPPENVQAMVDSDLIGLIIPKDRGGYGIDSWMTVVDVVTEVGRHCGASGWCFDLLIQHHWVFGMFPGECQDQVYKADPRPKIGTSFMPASKVTRAPGGYRVTGDWSFSSGIDHSDWAILGGAVPAADGSGPPDVRFFMFAPGEFKPKDTWYAVGLKGSGSNNVVVNDVFVREEFTVRAADFGAGQTPGSKVNKGVMFKEPGYVAFPFGIFCPLMGIARGALDSFTDFAKTRAASAVRDPLLQLLNTQRAIGEAAAEIDAAYLLAKDNDEKLMAGLPNGEADMSAIRRNFTLASRLAIRGVDRLFEASGARGILDSNPIQRFWRDVHAAGNHVAWGVETGYTNAGAFAMGMPPAGATGIPAGRGGH